MRLGVDLGGTKTEILAMGHGGSELWRKRVASPKTYEETLQILSNLVKEAEAETRIRGTIGLAIPGCETEDKLIKNANSIWLNGRPLGPDLQTLLGRPVRLANDANCFALSEASDGAAHGANVVFGVILGTGVGGGIVVNGSLVTGSHGVGGEWGHIPLPNASVQEVVEAPACFCGKRGCIETWCSGPGLAADLQRQTGKHMTAEQIAASKGEEELSALARLTDRLARGLATVVNILDPDVVVLGGGLSNIEGLYRDLPPLVESYGFTLGGRPRIVKNRHGDSSGVRGAAWLWPEASI